MELKNELENELKNNVTKNVTKKPKEVWKQVDYIDSNSGEIVKDDKILVSNRGRVKSLKMKKPKILKTPLQNSGYPIVRVGGKWRTVHRIIAHMFLENPDGLLEIDHINNVKTDNRADNLRFVSPEENSKKRVTTSRKRTYAEIINDSSQNLQSGETTNSKSKEVYCIGIDGKLIRKFQSICAAAKEIYGSWKMINDCVKGKILLYKGCIWLEYYSKSEIKDRIEKYNNQTNKRYPQKYNATKVLVS